MRDLEAGYLGSRLATTTCAGIEYNHVCLTFATGPRHVLGALAKVLRQKYHGSSISGMRIVVLQVLNMISCTF